MTIHITVNRITSFYVHLWRQKLCVGEVNIKFTNLQLSFWIWDSPPGIWGNPYVVFFWKTISLKWSNKLQLKKLRKFQWNNATYNVSVYFSTNMYIHILKTRCILHCYRGTGRKVSSTDPPLILLQASVCDRLAPGSFLKPKMLSRWWNSNFCCPFHWISIQYSKTLMKLYHCDFIDFVVGLICCESMWLFILPVLFLKGTKDHTLQRMM